MSTFENILIFVKKYILYFIIAWIIFMIITKIVLSRTSHNELFTWFNNQDNTKIENACISAWKISSSIELPTTISNIYSKPFENKATPYFLDSLARRYGDPNAMPPPHSPPMDLDDWCIGIGMRLYNWASDITTNFTAPQGAIGTNKVSLWAISNLALSLDGGNTVIDGYTVYQKYGSPMAWQFPHWQGWLACRIRPPGYPSWDTPDPNNPSYLPANPIYTPHGTFEWGSSFVQTGYLPPYGCLGSKCADPTATCTSTNRCGNVSTQDDSSSCSVNGTCLTQPNPTLGQGAVQKHQLLPYTFPYTPGWGDLGCTQYASNNPFIAYEIPASAPIILRFLGYGFDQPDTTNAPGGSGNTNVFTGGPGTNQYTQIEQFITLVNNGGFYGYAETNSNMSQSQLENYLFGYYTFEEKGVKNTPKPTSNNCSNASLIGDTVSGGIGGLGAGLMAASMITGPAGLVAGAALTAGSTASAYLSSKGRCSGGSSCAIM
jgi:hypothetical protein